MEFGGHAAGAQMGPGPGQRQNFFGQGRDLGNEGGVRMGVGVGGVETVNVRQENEYVGLHADGHDGGQGVVVADAQLFGGHGVVFVDNGQNV